MNPISVPMKNGPCFGGPLNTKTMTTAFELGLLYVSVLQNWVWIYNWNAQRRAFFCVNNDGQEIVPTEEWPRYGVENENKYQLVQAPEPPPPPQDE